MTDMSTTNPALFLPFTRFLSYAHGAFSECEGSEPWFQDVTTLDEPTTGIRVHLGPSTAAAAERLVTSQDLAVHGRGAPGGEIQFPAECKYCTGSLIQERDNLPCGSHRWYHRTGFAVAVTCESCGWWKLCKYRRGEMDDPFEPVMAVTAYFFEGIVYDFQNEPSARSVEVIRRQLARKQVDLTTITPRDLELVVGAVLRDFHGSVVHHVGGPGDGGLDLLVSEAPPPIA